MRSTHEWRKSDGRRCSEILGERRSASRAEDASASRRGARRRADAAPTPAETLWPSSLTGLRSEIDWLFDSFTRGFPFGTMFGRFPTMPAPTPVWRVDGGFAVSAPAVDVAEKNEAFEITAELPGLDPSNVDVTVANDTLTIKGERKEEQERKDKNYYVSERRYGSFRLPDSVDRDKIAATFEKGILTVTLPKTAAAMQQEKKIAIEAK